MGSYSQVESLNWSQPVTPLSEDLERESTAIPRATMREVAALAGVGIKTVSRVINNEPNVSADLTARVRAAAERLNYQPDIHAGNLRRSDRKTRTLGLIVGSVANPFSGAVNRGVEDVAADRGVAVFTSSLDDDASRETRIVTEMLRRRVDGIILTTVKKNQAYLLPEQQRGTAFVFVDRQPSGIDADAVLTNNAEAASQAVAHLASVGHRSIGYLGDRAELWTAHERRRGFFEQLGAIGIPTAAVTAIDDLHDEDSAYRATLGLFATDSPPTALFTSQNLVTIGTIRALRQLGLHHEIALVGFDDIPLGDMLEPGVTVVAQNPYQIGRTAADRAFARLEGDRSEARAFVVPSTLIIRGSGEIRPRS